MSGGEIGGNEMKTIATILALTLSATATAYDGLREGEREMLDRIRSKDASRQDYRQYRYERDNANHTGYSDRKRIRELEMRKRELHGDLKRAKSPSERWGIESQIIGIDRQIEQISAPRY